MAEGKAEITVGRSPDEVWDLVGDFDGLADWMPGIEECKSDGKVRVLSTMGMEMHEELRQRDDSARSLTYSIVQSPLPLEHHEVTISVDPEGDGSKVTWAYDVRPDEMAPVFGTAYEGALKAVAARLA
jgi:carbon monoxide dehydrogenase subunit G